jgi:hypothetical protein
MIIFVEHINLNHNWQIEIAQKQESSTGFIPQKNRWQVERNRFGGPIWLAESHGRPRLGGDCLEMSSYYSAPICTDNQ